MADSKSSTSNGKKPKERVNGIAAGVKKEEFGSSDYYRGTKDELIAAGICKAEWFPAAPVVIDKRGRVKRSFSVETRFGSASLHDYADGIWGIYLPVSETEVRRRAEDYERKQHQERARAAEHEKQAISVLKRRLPPLDDELSTAEIDHLRVMRAINEAHRSNVVDLTEFLFLRGVGGKLTQPIRALKHLTLVVDNEI